MVEGQKTAKNTIVHTVGGPTVTHEHRASVDESNDIRWSDTNGGPINTSELESECRTHNLPRSVSRTEAPCACPPYYLTLIICWRWR